MSLATSFLNRIYTAASLINSMMTVVQCYRWINSCDETDDIDFLCDKETQKKDAWSITTQCQDLLVSNNTSFYYINPHGDTTIKLLCTYT